MKRRSLCSVVHLEKKIVLPHSKKLEKEEACAGKQFLVIWVVVLLEESFVPSHSKKVFFYPIFCW